MEAPAAIKVPLTKSLLVILLISFSPRFLLIGEPDISHLTVHKTLFYPSRFLFSETVFLQIYSEDQICGSQTA